MKNKKLLKNRVSETLGFVLIADGMVGLFDTERHLRLWRRGFATASTIGNRGCQRSGFRFDSFARRYADGLRAFKFKFAEKIFRAKIKNMKTQNKQQFSIKQILSLFSLVIFGLSICAAQTSSGYHLLKKIQIGGEGGWDYIFDDANAHRLYVSHATKVVVIDTDKDTIVGEIPNTNGVHGVAVAEKLGRGFTSNGRDNSVTIFDLKTLKTLDTVKVGENPDTIIYDAATKRIFTFNGRSSDATAIDAASGKVVGTIALGGRPEFAISDEKGTIFVNIEDKSEVVAFDPNKLEVKNRWAIAPGEEPSGMAFDPKTRRLFVVCANEKMIILNADNGKVVADLPTGKGTDAAAFDSQTCLAFSSNGEGTLTVVREEKGDKFSVVENVLTQRGARTMTLDTKTGKIYLPTAEFGATPAPTAERPRPRPAIVPDSFVILVFGK